MKKHIIEIIRWFLSLEYKYRMILKNSGTILINFGIGIFKLMLGIYYFSDWLIANSLYYLALAVAKGHVIKRNREIVKIEEKNIQMKAEKTLFNRSGVFQCLVGISYFFVSLHTLLTGEIIKYPDYLRYVVVIIALGKVIGGIGSVRMSFREPNPVTAVLCIIDFTDAVVSIVVARSILQVSQHAEFAVESSGIFGMICSIIFVFTGIYMLIYKKNKKKCLHF